MENGSSGGCGFLYKFGGDGVYSVIVLSRNDAVGRAVPPHPGPLPRGEGEPFGSAIKGHRLVFSSAVQKGLPLLGERAGVRGNAMFELHGYG